MPRYRNISENQLTPKKVVRVVNAHSNGTTLTAEGPVTTVVTEAVPSNLIRPPGDVQRINMVPVAVTFGESSQITMALSAKGGWSCTHIQEIAEDLPTTEGSVIRCTTGLVGILVTDLVHGDGAPRWVYSHALEHPVPDELLATAVIIHRA